MSDFTLILFLISIAGIILNTLFLVSNILKKKDKKINKVIYIVLVLTFITSIALKPNTGDTSDTGAIADASQETQNKNTLNNSEKELLKKSYFDFDSNQRTTFAEIEEKYNRMDYKEKEDIKKDFERVSIERDQQVALWENEKNQKTKEVGIKQNSPKEVVETYFTSWKNKDYKAMYEVAQPTWKKNNKEDVIEAWYDFKTLKNFQIQNEEENNMKIGDKDLTMTKVTVKVTYEALQGKDETKTIIINAVKEESKWWVNPTSALREE